MKRLRRILFWLVGIYAAVVLVLLAGQDRLAFAGWTFRKPWLAVPEGVVVDEVSIASPDGNTIHGWWLPRETANSGAALYFHGNGENISSCGKTLRNWRNELQMPVLGIDYPGYGKSSGTPTEESCYAAAQAALEWLAREKKVTAAQVVVIGQSLGSAMATEVAVRQRCRLLIISSAFTNFPDAAQAEYPGLPARYLVHLRFDNLAKMEKIETPVFIAHGTDDRRIPFSQGQQLYAAVARAPKRFFAAPGLGHSQPDTTEFYEAVRQFLKETGR